MEKGAVSPGRWQVWEFFCKIGGTSLLNVGGGLFGSCPSAYPAQQSVLASRRDKYFMNFSNLTILDLARQNRTESGKLAGQYGFRLNPFPTKFVKHCSKLVVVRGPQTVKSGTDGSQTAEPWAPPLLNYPTWKPFGPHLRLAVRPVNSHQLSPNLSRSTVLAASFLLTLVHHGRPSKLGCNAGAEAGAIL